MDNRLTFSVTQLNDYVKALIDSSEVLSNIAVVGEISNFTNHYKSGHMYFSLKDSESLIKAVMFRTYASRVNFEVKENMKVLAIGRVSVFPRDGVYQLYVEHMEPFGIGDLYKAYEQLKNKLSALGLFDSQHKKPIPKYPKKIGIITAPDGAAVADMKNIISRRYPLCEICIYPSLVQGPDAPADLINGLLHFDSDDKCDTIIIGRGGGSIEDLWAFNDENLARCIFGCKTPVISAVGHETDFTICDFVADLRAPTPSAAAELAVPDIKDLKNTLLQSKSLLESSISLIISKKRTALESKKALKILAGPKFYLESKMQVLSKYEIDIQNTIEKLFKDKSSTFSSLVSKLTALNPMAVLSRGYGAVFDSDGKVISSTKSVDKGQKINLELSDGKLEATVDKVIQNNGGNNNG